jgi:hypothetical protein
MPGAHPAPAQSPHCRPMKPKRKSLFPASLAWNKTCSYFSHPWERCVPEYFVCIQTGWRGRNRCIACRNEAQIRIWDIAPPDRPSLAAGFRTAHTGTLSVWLPSGVAAVQMCCLALERTAQEKTSVSAPRYDPDNRVGDTSYKNQISSGVTLSRARRLLTSPRGRHSLRILYKRGRIVFPYLECYHPFSASEEWRKLWRKRIIAAEFCGF